MNNRQIIESPFGTYSPISEERFSKAYKKHANHEVWQTCRHCRKEFDLRTNWDNCPKCKQLIK